MSYCVDQVERIAIILDGLNEIDKRLEQWARDKIEREGKGTVFDVNDIFLGNGIKVYQAFGRDPELLGVIGDEIGGAYSFIPTYGGESAVKVYDKDGVK